MTEDTSTIELVLQSGYRFEVDFALPGVPRLVTDSPAPLGQGAGPDAEKLLISAVANCLSSSLLFSLRKFKNELMALRTTASGQLVRNEQGRLRVGSIQVEIRLEVPAGALKQLDRALLQFEDFCVVTQSVRASIPVAVRVVDSEGAVLAG
jgi:organic hydroperoxide reductase OsmC/OhrA